MAAALEAASASDGGGDGRSVICDAKEKPNLANMDLHIMHSVYQMNIFQSIQFLLSCL